MGGGPASKRGLAVFSNPGEQPFEHEPYPADRVPDCNAAAVTAVIVLLREVLLPSSPAWAATG